MSDDHAERTVWQMASLVFIKLRLVEKEMARSKESEESDSCPASGDEAVTPAHIARSLVNWVQAVVDVSACDAALTLCDEPGRCPPFKEWEESEDTEGPVRVGDRQCPWASPDRVKILGLLAVTGFFDYAILVTTADLEALENFVTYCLRSGPVRKCISDTQTIAALKVFYQDLPPSAYPAPADTAEPAGRQGGAP